MKKYCFIVPSCIFPCDKKFSYSNVRSVYDPSERLAQTQNTINSIHKKCPDAYILLVENGLQDIKGQIDGVDEYRYIGQNWIVRLLADSQYKSLGELTSLLFAAKRIETLMEQYNFRYVFKLSGRYWLNDNFSIDQLQDAFCFHHIINTSQEILGIHEYVSGSHSSRLFAFPGKAIREFYWSLIRTIPWFLRGKSLEEAWPKQIQYPLCYIHRIGVSGYVGVDKSFHEE